MYQQKLADETSKVIADNPLAYEYDRVYDEMKETSERQKWAKVPEKKSKYIEEMVLHTERRQRE